MDLLSEVMTLRFVCQGRCRRLRREDRNDRAKRAGRGQEIAALIARNDARSARTGYTKRPRRSEATTRPTVRQDTNSPPRAGEGEGTKGWVVCAAKRGKSHICA